MIYGDRTYWSYAASLLLLTGMIYYWTRSAFLVYGIFVLLLLVLIPFSGILIIRLWQKLTLLIGKVNGTIFLSLIFFLMVTPIGIVRRIFGSDVLGLKKRDVGSYFEDVEGEYDLEGAERVW